MSTGNITCECCGESTDAPDGWAKITRKVGLVVFDVLWICLDCQMEAKRSDEAREIMESLGVEF